MTDRSSENDRPAPHTRRTQLLVVAAYAAFVLLMLSLFSCSSTRTVTVPAAESTVRVEPADTIRLGELPPLEPRGSLTAPEEVLVVDDTSAPTFEVSLLEVDRTDPDEQAVHLRIEQGAHTVEKRFALPTVGEGLRVRVDTAAASVSSPADSGGPDPPLRETVFGQPSDYTVEADVSEIERPWWERTWMHLRLILAFIGGMAFGYVVTKLVPGL